MEINYKPRKLIPRYTYKVNYKSNIWTIMDSFKKISDDTGENSDKMLLDVWHYESISDL